MDDYKLAQEIAIRAHAGQVDRAGEPYIRHPIAVSALVQGDTEKIVALLHDVVEDTPITLESIRVLFGDTIADAVGLVTHEPGVDYFEYVRRAGTNPIAKAVKIADLTHNSDPRRMKNPTEKDARRLEKYAKALEILTQGER